ncbi:MAG TPA: NADP-dependent phosphogluconate dehydrogenase [Polyangia bacterium]|nr:NADP-dependent phosphogluconate dehydrogenase [Polyangia bacterium]
MTMETTSQKAQIGVVGMGVMGENLARNAEEKGFQVAVYNRTPDAVDKVMAKAKAQGATRIQGYRSVNEFVNALERPRRILIMVKAGAAVDATIDSLRPYLDEGDLIIDGGNEYFTNTQARQERLTKEGIRFVGMGVSGGEEGARKGPSLMPGGDRSIWEDLRPVLSKIAAQYDGEPCVDYMGPGGAGHYVKMVHNGIEYGDMQLIAEAYDILKNLGGMSNEEISGVFREWNKAELDSFLMEISYKVLLKKDPETGKSLCDLIVDVTGSKGTGKWTVEQAAELATPVSVISASLEARYIAGQKAQRIAASKKLAGPKPAPTGDKATLVNDVKQALYASKICSYAQGLNMLAAASKTYNWGIELAKIPPIWRAGCIIRARFLADITNAYRKNPALPNLMMDDKFAKDMNDNQAGWRRVIGLAIQNGIGVPSFTAALGYYDSYRRERLPANLTQAQRDYFGAHTFERIDKEPGKFFHADWSDVSKA